MCECLHLEEETVDGAVDQVGHAELVAEDMEVGRTNDAIGREIGNLIGLKAKIAHLTTVAPVGEEEEGVVGRHDETVVLSRRSGEMADVGRIGDVVDDVQHILFGGFALRIERGDIEMASLKAEAVGARNLYKETKRVDVDSVGILNGEDIDATGIGDRGKEGAALVDDEIVDHEVFFRKEDGLWLSLEVFKVIDHDGVEAADEEVVLIDSHTTRRGKMTVCGDEHLVFAIFVIGDVAKTINDAVAEAVGAEVGDEQSSVVGADALAKAELFGDWSAVVFRSGLLLDLFLFT